MWRITELIKLIGGTIGGTIGWTMGNRVMRLMRGMGCLINREVAFIWLFIGTFIWINLQYSNPVYLTLFNNILLLITIIIGCLRINIIFWSLCLGVLVNVNYVLYDNMNNYVILYNVLIVVSVFGTWFNKKDEDRVYCYCKRPFLRILMMIMGNIFWCINVVTCLFTIDIISTQLLVLNISKQTYTEIVTHISTTYISPFISTSNIPSAAPLTTPDVTSHMTIDTFTNILSLVTTYVIPYISQYVDLKKYVPNIMNCNIIYTYIYIIIHDYLRDYIILKKITNRITKLDNSHWYYRYPYTIVDEMIVPSILMLTILFNIILNLNDWYYEIGNIPVLAMIFNIMFTINVINLYGYFSMFVFRILIVANIILAPYIIYTLTIIDNQNNSIKTNNITFVNTCIIMLIVYANCFDVLTKLLGELSGVIKLIVKCVNKLVICVYNMIMIFRHLYTNWQINKGVYSIHSAHIMGITNDNYITIDTITNIRNGEFVDKCYVCRQKYGKTDTLIMLKCSHYFHKTCILSPNNASKLCPYPCHT